jgi:hypothetical protein
MVLNCRGGKSRVLTEQRPGSTKTDPLFASQFPFWSEITGTEVKIETWSASNDFGLEADRATPRNLVILGTLFLEF